MAILDKAIVRLLPAVPRPVVRRISGRYIAGSELSDATNAVRFLNAQGKLATVDVLAWTHRGAAGWFALAGGAALSFAVVCETVMLAGAVALRRASRLVAFSLAAVVYSSGARGEIGWPSGRV